ncbi:MAG: divergent PAP2 family protein [Clostridiales bacterium]|nr:divergent PAP2 family protein [Clostridiales bacterium]
MNFFTQLGQNEPLMCAALSWLIAQIIKTVLHLLVEKKLDARRLVGMGGMPSSHTAFVFSLCLMMGLQEGFSSPAFAVSFALAAVVIYDAMGVRRETGKQGAVINRIVRSVLIEGKHITEENLKELVGHTPLEVLGGIILAIIMVIVMA